MRSNIPLQVYNQNGDWQSFMIKCPAEAGFQYKKTGLLSDRIFLNKRYSIHGQALDPNSGAELRDTCPAGPPLM
jgi:hypothetical protein